MKHARSEELFACAQKLIPGGVNSPVRAFRGVGGTPPFIARGAGSRIYDVDGNEYIDYVLSWGPLILGHCFPPVMEALREVLAIGTSFGAPTEWEVELAQLIRECVPSIEMVRLVSSGTEATMSALRVARGFTGRDLTIKFEGCYHGHVDSLLVKAGSGMATLGIADTAGVPESFAATTIALPFNSMEAVESAFREHGSKIAAVIVEPVVGNMGCVPPKEGFLAFLRHEMVDRERVRLLRASQESIDNLKRLQMQFVQSEKLASIGQLVGGAAHEINNPLTAILGYSELLADDASATEKTRRLAEKIREQARRTKTLVNNLLSFARQVPSEQRSPLDINTIVNTSAQFRRFDLRGKNIRIEVQTGTGIPEVRADMNQLLQVFSNIINNAVYAMQEAGGGTLSVRTLFEKGNVVILFSDTGPGIRDPRLVFDPFYTTKPVGKGTGLGLSICYGLIQDQGGQITCYNRPEGGATFRIELPAVPAAFPFSPRSVISPPRSNPAKLA